MRSGQPHEPVRQQENRNRHLLDLVMRAVLRWPFRGVHPRREARAGPGAAGHYLPQVRRHVPRPARPPAMRRSRSPSSSSDKPTLRSHSSGSKAFATSGCTSCMWKACARWDCGKNNQLYLRAARVCAVGRGALKEFDVAQTGASSGRPPGRAASFLQAHSARHRPCVHQNIRGKSLEATCSRPQRIRVPATS